MLLLTSVPAPPGLVQSEPNPPSSIGGLSYEKSYPGSAFAMLPRLLQPRLADVTGGLLTGVYQVPGDLFATGGGGPQPQGCDHYDDTVLVICSSSDVPAGPTIYVDKDWIIKTDLTLQNLHLIFRNTRDTHHAILADPGVALTLSGVTFDEQDHDRSAFGFLVARGTTTIRDSYFNETMVGIFATADNYGGGSSVTNTHFDHTITALTTNQNLAVRQSVFTRSYTGIYVDPDMNVDRKADLLGTGNPLVTDSTFEMNEVAMHLGIASSGNYSRNRVAANGLGVWCWGNGDQNDDGDSAGLTGWTDVAKPRINESNIYLNYGEAYEGVNGTTLGVPGIPLVKIPGSACQYVNNWIGCTSAYLAGTPCTSGDQESRALGSANANVADSESWVTSEISLTAPNLPWTPNVISTTTTWDSGHMPSTISAPVIVNSAGKLTINGITLDTQGYTIGAKKSANNDGIHVTNTKLTGSTTLYLRNDRDSVDNLILQDEALFEGVSSFRDSATINRLYASNVGPNAMGVFLFGMLALDGTNWQPTVTRSVVEHASAGIFIAGGFPTIEYNYVNHTRGPGFQSLLSPNNVLAVGRWTFSSNHFHNTTLAVNAAGKTAMASDHNTLDGGAIGYLGLGLDNMTFSHDQFTNFLIGHLSIGDLSVDVGSSLFAFNLLSMGAVATPVVADTDNTHTYVTVESSNFNYSYGAALFTWDIPLIVQTGIATAGRIQCSHSSGLQCYLQDDERADSSAGGTIDVSVLSTAPNTVDQPDWYARRHEVAGGTVDLGTYGPQLTGPVIARHGGTIRVADGTFDLNGFPVGAKSNGPNGSASPGQLVVENAHLKNGAFLGLGTPSDRVTIRNSTFTNFTVTALGLFQTSPTVTCSQFTNSGGAAYLLKGTSDNFVFDKDLVRNTTQGVSAGFERRIHDWHENVLVNHSGFLGVGTALLRNANASMQAHNSVFSERTNPSLDNRNIAFLDNAYVTGAPRANLTDSFWGHSTGAHVRAFDVTSIDVAPDVLRPNQTVLYDGYGLDLWLVKSKDDGKLADWNSTFLTSAPSLDPCAAFTYAPLSPLDWQNVTFDGTFSFDPVGAALANYTWDFGDQNASYVASPMHKFGDHGAYTVTLTVTTAQGHAASASRVVTVLDSSPVANFTNNASSTDEMHDVQFNDTSTHPNAPVDRVTNWSWEFRDGGTSTLQNPTHRYADGGNKIVNLTVTDDDGMTSRNSTTVYVPHVPPVANYTWSGALETGDFTFTDHSTAPNAANGEDHIVQWDWACSDHSSSSNTTTGNWVHRFPDGGPTSSATCSLTVTDDDGMTNTSTQTIPIENVPPKPAFTASDVTEPDPVSFTDGTTHDNANDTDPATWTYAWNFNNEGTSSSRNPSFSFHEGGDKTVTLTVTDNDGASASVTKTVTVRQAQPKAFFEWSPTYPIVGQTVTFSDKSTNPNPADYIENWTWNFADGSLDYTQNPTHAFAAAGQYDVNLTVTDGDGQVGSVLRTVTVSNRAPVANWTYTPSTPTDMDTITFNGSASYETGGTLTQWAWDFGDGNTTTRTTNETVTHRYVDNGIYYPKLTVTDDANGTGSMQLSINVTNVPPTASFTWTPPLYELVNATIEFHDTSTDPEDGNATQWYWQFGDGNTSTERNPVHPYARWGTYNVNLTVWDSDGDSNFVVTPVPVCLVGLSYEDIVICFQTRPG